MSKNGKTKTRKTERGWQKLPRKKENRKDRDKDGKWDKQREKTERLGKIGGEINKDKKRGKQ